MTPSPPTNPSRVDKGRCKLILRGFATPTLIVSQRKRRFNWLGGQLYVALSPALMSMTEGGLGGDQMEELGETRRHCVGQKHRCERKQETAREAFGLSR